MKIRHLLALFLLASHLAWGETQELVAPNATRYLEIHSTRTDLRPLIQKSDAGFRLRFGAQFNDVTLKDWTWGWEGSLNLLSNIGERFSETRATKIGEFINPAYDTVTIVNKNTVQLNGFEIGARLSASQHLYIRSGLFIHNIKEKEQISRTLIDTDTGAPTSHSELAPSTQSSAAIKAYLGAGFLWPIYKKISLITEYNIYQAEGELLDVMSAGLHMKL